MAAAQDFSESLSKEQRELALWSFPLVADSVQAHYAAQAKLSTQNARFAAFNHSHLWRALLLRDQSNAQKFRAALDRILMASGTPPSLALQLDEALLDELLIVVSERFQRSPRRALELNHILLRLARELTALRLSRQLSA